MKNRSRRDGATRFAHSTEQRDFRRVDTLFFQRVFTVFRRIIKTAFPRQSGTVENCVQIMSRVVDWYLKPEKRPGFYGWHDPVKGIRLSRGIVGHLEYDEHGEKTWVPDIKEHAEKRALQILSCMGLLERITEGKMGRKKWLSSVRYLRVHPHIASIMRMETPPTKSFDEARAEVEAVKADAKARGLKHGVDQFTRKIPRWEGIGMTDVASFKLVAEVPTPDHSDEVDDSTVSQRPRNIAQAFPGEGFNRYGVEKAGGAPRTPVGVHPTVDGVLSSEEERITPEAPTEKTLPASGVAQQSFSEKHHSIGAAIADAGSAPLTRPRIPDTLSSAALVCIQRSNASNPVLRSFYVALPAADKNTIREVDRRFFEKFPQEAEPEQARGYRDTPPGCEEIADKSLTYTTTWDSGAAKNSHTFQFLTAGISIRDWLRRTFPGIEKLRAYEVRQFTWRLHRDGLGFLRFIDRYYVDASTGIGHSSIQRLGQILAAIELAENEARDGDRQNAYGASLLTEPDKPWRSINPPSRQEVVDACSRGNPGGYHQALMRWSKLTPAEMQAI